MLIIQLLVEVKNIINTPQKDEDEAISYDRFKMTNLQFEDDLKLLLNCPDIASKQCSQLGKVYQPGSLCSHCLGHLPNLACFTRSQGLIENYTKG